MLAKLIRVRRIACSTNWRVPAAFKELAPMRNTIINSWPTKLERLVKCLSYQLSIPVQTIWKYTACEMEMDSYLRCLFIQQKMKIRSHTAEFKLLAFSAANIDLSEKSLHICCMARSLRSLRQVATLRHDHMAPLRFAPAFGALGVCEHSWLRYNINSDTIWHAFSA